MSILLHICCAVCASWAVESLRQDDFEVTGFFYNPNIQPDEEYLKRLKDTRKLAREQDFTLISGEYDNDKWLGGVKGLEKEPEGGQRCRRCFRMRLEKTADTAREKAFHNFTTTLTISPHKNAQLINGIGRDIAGGLFLERDFKKKDGFKKAQQLARQYNLYHQNYCGCMYSL